MPQNQTPKYYLVESTMLPEVFIKVTKAKELLETGEASTVAQAVSSVGISRSAFYKYKDYISPFMDMKRGHITTFHIMLRDKPGVLSAVLSVFAGIGANILTINQSIPINGTAAVTISAETAEMTCGTEELLSLVAERDGVLKIELLAG